MTLTEKELYICNYYDKTPNCNACGGSKSHKQSMGCLPTYCDHLKGTAHCRPYNFQQKEEKKMKYEQVNNITIDAIWEKATTKDQCFLRHFGDLLNETRDLSLHCPFDRFIHWAEKDIQRTAWLIDKGFIKIRKEMFYKIGDRFTDKLHEYILVGMYKTNYKDRSVNLIDLETGCRYGSNHVLVKDLLKITEEEFEKLRFDGHKK